MEDVCGAVILTQKNNSSKKSLKVQYCHDVYVGGSNYILRMIFLTPAYAPVKVRLI